MFVGFAYAVYFIIGANSNDFSNFWYANLRLFYLVFGRGTRISDSDSIIVNVVTKIFFVMFFLIFSFVLFRVLITIVIVRYKYLRSKVQLDNEANARIMQEKSKKINAKIIDLLLCRRENKDMFRSRNKKSRRQNSKKLTTHFAFWETAVLNYSDIKEMSKLETMEVKQENLKAMKEEIKIERKEKQIERDSLYSVKNFPKHKRN